MTVPMNMLAETRRPLVFGDSWGGWVVVLMVSCNLLYSAVSVLFDGRQRVGTSTGRVVVTAGGSFGTWVAAACLLSAIACSVFALLTSRPGSIRLGSAVTLPLVILLVWGVMTSWLRGDDWARMVEASETLLMASAVIVSNPTRTTIARLSTLRDALTVGSLIYSPLMPAVAQSECRADKCGIFGSLWYGLFENENVAGASIVLLLPTLLVADRARFHASLLLALVFIGSTGSRTAITASIVSVLFILATRRWGAQQTRPGLHWRVVPASMLLVSLFVFLGSTGQSFTGRGYIYSQLSAKFKDFGTLIIGPGPRAFDGLLDGWVTSAHGEAPNDLIMFGWPGFVLLLLALADLLFVKIWTVERLVALGVLVTASIRFPTETGLMLNFRTTETALLFLIIGLFVVSPRDVTARPLTEWRRRRPARKAEATASPVRSSGSSRLRV